MLSATSQAANVAFGKKVYASSNQQPPELAVDDNLGTRWESKASDGDNQWFYVDLEKETIIDHLKIVWEGAYGKHYKIHVADEITAEMALKLTDDDKTNDFATGWTEIAEINKTLSGFPASETIAVSTTDVVTARYVAVELIERGSSYGFSFWEFGVYDMAEEASKLSSIEITADKLEGSVSDPIPAFTVTNGIGMTNRHDWLTSEEAVKARYVKFHSTRAATQYGTKLYELEVYSNSKSELTSVMIAADKECGTPGDYTFTLTGLDQFGGNYDISGDKGVWKASAGLMNGNVLIAEEAGAYEVYYTAENGLQSNTVTVDVVNPKGDNLALNRPVTVSEGDQTGNSKPENAVDGVDAAGSLWGAAEPAGSKDHTYDCWIVVELEKVFKIDAVKASWEGANSCRYTVEASTDGKTFTVFGSYDRPARLEARTDWFAGKGIEAKYIKVYSTKASTEWGTKLQELYVYDVNGTTSSVASIAVEGTIFVAGSEEVLPEGTVEATVFNLNGAVVAHAEGTDTMSIATVQPGVYVVKAVKADGTVVTAKIVK